MSDAAGRVAAEWLAKRADAADLPTPFFVADDESDAVPQLLAELGIPYQRWRRFAGPVGVPGTTGEQAVPWPEAGAAGAAGAAALRLPKGRQALHMALHAALSRIEPGGRIWLYGHNSEGVRSAGKSLEAVCTDVVSAEAKRHCRVWTAVRGDGPLRSQLSDWEERYDAELPGGPVALVSYPGLFAHGRLDPATALLAGSLPGIAPGARVLDFGCGAGALSAAVLQAQPAAVLHGLDLDALAIEAARRNLPSATLHLGSGFDALPAGLRFAHIVSNPPFHAGVARDTGPIQELIAGAMARLDPGGVLQIVSQSTIPLDRWLAPHFRRVARAAETRSFRVWRAQA